MFAVTPHGAGNPAEYRAIAPGESFDPSKGETFIIDEIQFGKVLDTDLVTFIDETDAHRTARSDASKVRRATRSLDDQSDTTSKILAVLMEDIAVLKSIAAPAYKEDVRRRIS